MNKFIEDKLKEFDDNFIDKRGWFNPIKKEYTKTILTDVSPESYKDFIKQTIQDTIKYVKEETMLEEMEIKDYTVEDLENPNLYSELLKDRLIKMTYNQAVKDQKQLFKKLEE